MILRPKTLPYRTLHCYKILHYKQDLSRKNLSLDFSLDSRKVDSRKGVIVVNPDLGEEQKVLHLRKLLRKKTTA